MHKSISMILENRFLITYISSYFYGDEMEEIRNELDNMNSNIDIEENISSMLIKIIEQLVNMRPHKQKM